MTTEEKNKRLHEILGLHWHENIELEPCVIACNCDIGTRYRCDPRTVGINIHENINFYTDAGTVQLLRELEKQEWYNTFIYGEFYYKSDTPNNLLNTLTTTGLLADKVIEWRKE